MAEWYGEGAPNPHRFLLKRVVAVSGRFSGYAHARMLSRITALVVLAATFAVAAIAHAAHVPIAFYLFENQADVDAFQKVRGAKCDKKWFQNDAMSIAVGPGTNTCAFRTNVIADSSDTAPDQQLSADGALVKSVPLKLQKKAYVGVGVRSSESSGYELRVRPVARKWQVFRDPKGVGEGPSLVASGSGKFIRPGLAKSNNLLLQAFDYGGATTQLLASVNGRSVYSANDTGNSQPDGRQTTLTVGVKGTGAGTGVAGVFDNVYVRIPNPF
jgi:hypothetical protein